MYGSRSRRLCPLNKIALIQKIFYRYTRVTSGFGGSSDSHCSPTVHTRVPTLKWWVSGFREGSTGRGCPLTKWKTRNFPGLSVTGPATRTSNRLTLLWNPLTLYSTPVRHPCPWRSLDAGPPSASVGSAERPFLDPGVTRGTVELRTRFVCWRYKEGLRLGLPDTDLPWP